MAQLAVRAQPAPQALAAPVPDAPPSAATAVVGQQHDKWAAFAFDDNGSPTCYAVTKTAAKGGDAFIYITHRPTENANSVFQFLAPFALQAGSKVTLTIDKNSFTLFADTNSAWARGSETDRAISEAIRRGHKVTVAFMPASASTGSKPTALNFETKGSSLALQAISRMCGL